MIRRLGMGSMVPQRVTGLWGVRRGRAASGLSWSQPLQIQDETESDAWRLTRDGVFAPTLADVPKDARALASYSWLVKAGFIRRSSNGTYMMLPLGLRVQERVERIVDEEMSRIGGQKLAMPLLLSSDLWKKTGRWESTGAELFRLQDRRGGDYCLGPTHEELFTDLVAHEVQSHRALPLRLYQTGRKYRDELRPRFGLMRAREFVMKDMYTFDRTYEEAFETYEAVTEAYTRVMERLELPCVRAEADSGNIGGSLSHEFHVLADVGEDHVLACECGYTANVEKASAVVAPSNAVKRVHLSDDDGARVTAHVPADWETPNLTKAAAAAGTGELRVVSDPGDDGGAAAVLLVDASLAGGSVDLSTAHEGDTCATCGHGTLRQTHGIEVGHTFYLGQKYSEALGASYMDADHATRFAEMGCYGLGISRIIASIAELHHDGQGLAWPASVAPYQCVVVLPSRAKPAVAAAAAAAYARAVAIYGHDQVLWDDGKRSIGYKMKDAALLGIPWTVVCGRGVESDAPHIEVVHRSDDALSSVVPLHVAPTTSQARA